MQSGTCGKYAPASHEYFMSLALDEAKKAVLHEDVPVGAVIVKDGEVIASAHNSRERDSSPTAHAELSAIEEASAKLGTWRLNGCVMYVTLEPCVMCAGAAVNCRMSEVVYGCADPKAGAMGSVINVNSYPLNHKPNITRGILESECAAILREFFALKR